MFIHCGEDVAFEIVPVQNNAVEMEEEPCGRLFHEVMDPLFGYSRPFVGLPWLLSPLKTVGFNDPLDVSGRDQLSVSLGAENPELFLAVGRILFPKSDHSAIFHGT